MIQIVLVLIAVGVLLWLCETYIPLDPVIKNIIRVVVIICVVLWLLGVFGLLPMDVPVPRLNSR